MVAPIKPREAASDLQRTQNKAINNISPEIWQIIFRLLDREQLINVALTHRVWSRVLEDDVFWKILFKRTIFYTNTLAFTSWKRTTLSYYQKKDKIPPRLSERQFPRLSHWTREIKLLDAPISYREEGLEFCEFVDSNSVLVKTKNKLKILKLEATHINEEFSHSYEGGLEAKLARLAISCSETNDQSPYVTDVQTYHQRFLVIYRSDGSIETIDFKNKRPSFAWKPQAQLAKNSVKPMRNSSILLAGEKQKVLSYHLETGKDQLHSEKVVFQWKALSENLLVLVFEDGLVQILNLDDGSSLEINAPIKDCAMKRAVIETGAVILFYSHDVQHRSGAKFINLKTGHNYTVKERNDDLNLISCTFLEDKNQLLLTYSQEVFDSEFKYFYNFVSLETGDLVLEFQSFTHCEEWIMCSDDCLLYIGDQGAIFAYDIKSKKEILLVDSKNIERRTFLEKQVFENKVFIWTEADQGYDSDGSCNWIECNVFDPLNFSISRPTPQSVYANEQNYFLVCKEGRFYLVNRKKLSTVLSSHTDPGQLLFYDKSNNRIVIGTNSARRVDEDYFEEEFSLEVCNLDSRIFSNPVTNERGCLSAIYDTGSVILAFITLADSKITELLEITASGNSRTRLERGITCENFIKGKILLNSRGTIYAFNIGNSRFDSAIAEAQRFEIMRDFVVVISKNIIEFFKVTNKH